MALRGFSTINFWADDVAAAVGNLLGVMNNPHYLEVLAGTGPAEPQISS